MIFTGILSLLGSSAVGSIIGGVSAYFNKKQEFQFKELELAQEVRKWAHDLLVKDKDLEYAKIELQGKKEIAIIEGDSAVDAARMAAIAVSHTQEKLEAEELKAAGKWKWLLVFANAATKFVRPMLTVALTGSAIYINLLLISFFTEGWKMMTDVQRYESGIQAFSWVTGQAAAIIAYWFVSRGNSK